jgi:predicted transposase YdaD
MLFGEWKLEDALVVEREEGREESREEIAKNALTKGASVEFISEITGLSAEAIQSLANR